MGVMAPTIEDHCSSNKPKERQFQVVPVPGVFCRGRWKCCDFRDAQNAEPDMLEFPKHGELANHDTIVVTSVDQNAGKAVETTTANTINVPIVTDKTGANDEGFASSASTNVLSALAEESTGKAVFGLTEADINRQASSATVNIPITQADRGSEQEDSQPQVGIHAIDSKIEQAMDLVKSHLTFAVREEVEDLRKTISKLEAKVTLLESQNALLKKYAPAEIVNNLSTMVQGQQIPPMHPKHDPEPPGSRTLSPLPNEPNMQ